MQDRLILASGSKTRRNLLANAGVRFDVITAEIDEDTLKKRLLDQNTKPADIATELAKTKARRISVDNPAATIIGCDQILEIDGRILSKPRNKSDAVQQLTMLNGRKHELLSAVVVYKNGSTHWRHVGKAAMHMRNSSAEYLNEYVDRNWKSIRNSVGCYRLEEEGVRLFARVEGDYFTVLGLPLTELLGYLMTTGALKV